jgi:hypothetical protein
MSDRRYVVGLAALAILIFSAIGASTASAEQVAYECSSSAASKTFSDAHCVSSGGSSFGHVKIEGTTEVSGTNAKTASETTAAAVGKLKSSLAGVETEIQCTTDKLISAKLTVTLVHITLDIRIGKSGCTVTKPAGKGCTVSGGSIETKELQATTMGQAAGNIKITPAEGTEFASIKIEKCSVEALNNTFPVTGSLVATATGATVSTTHAGITSQGTLKFGGVKAGLEGSLTITRTSTGNGIALT